MTDIVTGNPIGFLGYTYTIGGPPPPPPPPPAPLYTPGQTAIYNILTSNGVEMFRQPQQVTIMQVLDSGTPVFHYLVKYGNETPFQVPEYLLYTQQ